MSHKNESLIAKTSQFNTSAHMGLLEYLNVDAVDPVNNPHCMSIPTGQNEPIEWQTPSHWDTQNEINQSRNQAGPVPPSF